jgi:hypothetical protein
MGILYRVYNRVSNKAEMSFVPFDPLEFKNARINDAALGAIKREIENVSPSISFEFGYTAKL